MAEHERRLAAAGVSVLVVGFEEARRLSGLKDRIDSPFRFVVDADKTAYRAFSLGRATWARTYLHPDVVSGYARMIARGRMPDLHPGQDRRQLGGDFVFDREGRVVFSFRERGPEDRAPAGRIVAAAISLA